MAADVTGGSVGRSGDSSQAVCEFIISVSLARFVYLCTSVARETTIILSREPTVKFYFAVKTYLTASTFRNSYNYNYCNELLGVFPNHVIHHRYTLKQIVCVRRYVLSVTKGAILLVYNWNHLMIMSINLTDRMVSCIYTE